MVDVKNGNFMKAESNLEILKILAENEQAAFAFVNSPHFLSPQMKGN